MAIINGSGESPSREELLAGTLHGLPRKWLRGALMSVARPLLPLRVNGLEHVPHAGPLLLVSNHVSNADPIILELVSPRPLFFMGKQELFRNPIFHWLLDRFGGFPVERGTADRAALRHARIILANGIALGMFPEGGRSKTGALVRGHAGVGLLALLSQSPILPVGIYGTEFFPVNGESPPRRTSSDVSGVVVNIGAPFTMPQIVDGRRVSSEEATRLIMARIADLLPHQYRGTYAGDVEPTSDS